jgi:hypothetical protein
MLVAVYQPLVQIHFSKSDRLLEAEVRVRDAVERVLTDKVKRLNSYRLWCAGELRRGRDFFIVLYNVMDRYTVCGKRGYVKH